MDTNNTYQTTPHIIGYIDLLGTKNLVNETPDYFIDNFTKIIDFIDNPEPQQEVARNVMAKKFKNEINPIKNKVFSDNILLAVEYNPQSPVSLIVNATALISSISMLQKTILKHTRQISRGGICAGDLFLDKHFAFGSGLVSAYELESEIAKHPRVIIDKDLYTTLNTVNYPVFDFRNILITDDDNKIFVNFLHRYSEDDLNDVYHLVLDNTQKYEDEPNVLQKYNWTKKYILNYAKVSYPSLLAAWEAELPHNDQLPIDENKLR